MIDRLLSGLVLYWFLGSVAVLRLAAFRIEADAKLKAGEAAETSSPDINGNLKGGIQDFRFNV